MSIRILSPTASFFPLRTRMQEEIASASMDLPTQEGKKLTCAMNSLKLLMVPLVAFPLHLTILGAFSCTCIMYKNIKNIVPIKIIVPLGSIERYGHVRRHKKNLQK